MLINSLTTNETYFFREFEQLKSFAEHCLPGVLDRKTRNRDINIWSAGCSTGEEAYTLSIILLEMLDNYNKWNINIYATDINTEVLKKAERGVYSERSVKYVPREYFAKYFTGKTEEWKVAPDVKRNVKFENVNLINNGAAKFYKNIDFIFCRNVLIYFDDNSRKRVVNSFYESLNIGGYIFLGHSESMSRISTAFTPKRRGGWIVYEKAKE